MNKQAEPPALTLERFAAWLRAQPAEAAYCQDSFSQDCPVARWIAHHELAAPRKWVIVDGNSYVVSGDSRQRWLPEWAQIFVFEFDEGNPTQEEALAALGRTEARCCAG